MFRPAWVTEHCLKYDGFNCCGDEDLFPIRCPKCGHLCVLCYECDTFYVDLGDLSVRRTYTEETQSCSECGVDFPSHLLRNPDCRPDFESWHRARLDGLLNIPSLTKFRAMFIAAAEQIAGFLRRGMRSTAKTHLVEFRNLAESLSEAFSDPDSIRESARQVAQAGSLSEAIAWHDRRSGPIERAYAILGITDELFAAADGRES